MAAFLKRLNLKSKLNKNIVFDIDESNFELQKKFSSNNNHKNINFTMNHYTVGCVKCGNSEFSENSNFCRICGKSSV